MYDIIFMPYTPEKENKPHTLIERVACINPPHASDIPWLLREEGIYIKESGVILIVLTSDKSKVFRAYWYDPKQKTPSPLPHSTLPPHLKAEMETRERGRRGLSTATKRIIRRVVIGKGQ